MASPSEHKASISEDLEPYFLEQMREFRIVLSIGLKGSGKTFCSLKYIKYMLEHEPNVYDKYLLVLPAFKYEQNDSYAWLKKYKKEVSIYPYYSPIIFEQLNAKQVALADKGKPLTKYFFLFDDCTSAGATLFNIDEYLIKTIAECRHIQVGMWFNAHGASKILPTVLRNNADFIFIYTISNGKLFESLFEEFFSMNCDDIKSAFKEFRQQYRQHMKEKVYNSFMISIRNSTMDWNTREWKTFT